MTTAPVQTDYQYQYVADARTAAAMTRAFVLERGAGSLVVRFLAVGLIATALVYPSAEANASTNSRLLAAAVFGFGLAAIVWGLVLSLGFALNRRAMRVRFPAGATWSSGFGEHDWIVAGPLSAHRYTYDAVRSVRSRDDAVFVRLLRNPTVFVYPRVLFPDDAFARFTALGRRRPSRPMLGSVIFLGIAIALLAANVALDSLAADPPHYASATAIATALHDDGFVCDYQPFTGNSAMGATSAGSCRSTDFVVLIYVFDSEAQRHERQASFDRSLCSHGQPPMDWVTGERWLVGLLRNKDSIESLAPDLAAATGGELERSGCTPALT